MFRFALVIFLKTTISLQENLEGKGPGNEGGKIYHTLHFPYSALRFPSNPTDQGNFNQFAFAKVNVF